MRAVYEVSGDVTQISYSTSGIDGSPSCSYRGPKGDDQLFSGDDIQTLDTALGTEVTMTVADVADLQVITLTLVIPEMWIARGSGLAFKTMAVYVTRDARRCRNSWSRSSPCTARSRSTRRSSWTCAAGFPPVRWRR
jgi:hypothetical protein